MLEVLQFEFMRNALIAGLLGSVICGIMGTFVVVNLFIAVVINNLEEAKAERLNDLTLPPTPDEILRELRDTQTALSRIQSQLERFSERP